jgi:uncharacterized damage-inducible protein DinB
MSDPGSLFLASSVRYLTASSLDKLERVLPRVTDEDLWWRPNEASNSIGNLLMHLSGSLRFWIVSVAGGAPSQRVRELEFSTRGGRSREELIEELRTAVRDAAAVLENLSPDVLAETRAGFNKPVTVLDAIYHGVAHFSMHTGQILQLIKIRTGIDLGLAL